MSVSGSFLSSFNTNLPQCGSATSSFVITPPVPSGFQLAFDQDVAVQVNFGELNQPPQECISCGVGFGGTLVITGFIPTPAPEFPLGLVALFAVAVPLVLILRTRHSAKVTAR
jgi:hypothetical protein